MSEVFMFLILMFVVITLNLSTESERKADIYCFNVLSENNCQPNRCERCISGNNKIKSPYRRQII